MVFEIKIYIYGVWDQDRTRTTHQLDQTADIIRTSDHWIFISSTANSSR